MSFGNDVCIPIASFRFRLNLPEGESNGSIERGRAISFPKNFASSLEKIWFTILSYQSDLILSEKDEQGGSNFAGGIRNLAIEEADCYGGNYEKTDDQGDQEISDQSSFNGRIYHRSTFLFKEWFVLALGKEDLLAINVIQQILLKKEYYFLRILTREIFSKTLLGCVL